MGRGGKRRGHGHGHGGPRQQTMTAEQARQQMVSGDDRLVPFIRGREIDAGDLSGEVVEPVQASFTYFGKRFRVNPDLTETMVIDLLEAGRDVEVGEVNELVAAKDYVRDHLHPDDFDEFWQTSVDNRQGVQAIIKVCWLLLERITERPTTPPSGSSDGRPVTQTNSVDGVSEPVTESVPAEPLPQGNAREVGQRFAAKYEAAGRPDLANQVMLAVETREARGLVTV